MSLELDAELRRLYAAPLETFVEARKALAKALRLEGRKTEGQAVAKLAKPSLSVWATNQIAHRAPAVLSAYVEAHERARARQLRALADGDPEAKALAATAARHERRLLQAAVDAAARFLADAGRTTGRATLDKVSTNLRAAVVEAARQAQLETGVLDSDLAEPGFAVLAAGMEARPEWLEAEIRRRSELGSTSTSPEDDEETPSAAELAKASRRSARAEVARRLEQEREAARRRRIDTDAVLQNAERARDAAARAAAESETARSQAEAHVARAEAALDTARRQLHEAQARARAGAEALKRSQEARDRAVRARDEAIAQLEDTERACADHDRADPSP